jgi:hypothetical protein
MRIQLAVALWVIVMIIAVLNGVLAEYLIAPGAGDYVAHVYKSLVLIIVLFLAGWWYARAVARQRWLLPAVLTGILWLALTVLFEFGFARFVLSVSWEELLADYRIQEGRLWSVVLAATLLAPPLMAIFLVHLRQRPARLRERRLREQE